MFNLTEWVDGYCTEDPGLINQLSRQREDIEALIHSSLITSSKMAIVGPDEKTGYGVIASQLIPKGSRLVYAGYLDYIDSYMKNRSTYDPHMLVLFQQEISELAKQPMISGEKYRNIASLIHHAPTRKFLEEEVIFENPHLINKVATANFSQEIYSRLGELALICLEAEKDILPGNEIYFDYSSEYFLHLKSPIYLFEKETRKIINPSEFYFKNATLHLVQRPFHTPLSYEVKVTYSVKELFEKGVVRLFSAEDLNRSYDIWALPPFFMQDYFLEKPSSLLDIPFKPHPYVRYLSPQSRNKLSILFSRPNELLEIMIEKSFLDLYKKTKTQWRFELIQTSIKQHPSIFFSLYAALFTGEDNVARDVMMAILFMSGFSPEDVFKIPAKSELAVSVVFAFFRQQNNCPEYYIESMENIYKPSDFFQWQSNLSTSKIWLELGIDKEHETLLRSLRNHIKAALPETEHLNVKLGRNHEEPQNFILTIENPAIVLRYDIPPFSQEYLNTLSR